MSSVEVSIGTSSLELVSRVVDQQISNMIIDDFIWGLPFPTMSRATVSDEDRVANPIHSVKCEATMPGRVLRTKLEPLATDIKHVKHE